MVADIFYSGEILASSNRAIRIDANGNAGERRIGGAIGHTGTIGRIERSVVSGTDQLFGARIIVNGHLFMRASPIEGNEVSARQMDKDAILAAGRIGKVAGRISGHTS